jgi:hypothetical protein
MADVYVASQSAIIEHDGATVRVRKGVTRVAGNSSIYKKHPDLFKPAETDLAFEVRTTKAEPKVHAKSTATKTGE